MKKENKTIKEKKENRKEKRTKIPYIEKEHRK